MGKVCAWMFLVVVALVASSHAAPIDPKEKKTASEKKPAPEKTKVKPCRDGDVSADALIKAADQQSEQDRQLKTLRAEREILHAQVCGDSDSFQANLEAAREETARLIEANRKKCEKEMISIVPSMTQRVINANLLDTIRQAMHTVIQARFNTGEEEEDGPPEDEQLLPANGFPHSGFLVRYRRAPLSELAREEDNSYKHLCPTGEATIEALLAIGEAIGRTSMEYETMREKVVAMKSGTCPTSFIIEKEAKTKSAAGPPPMNCGDLKRVVQLYMDSFTSQLPQVEKTVEDSLQDMLPEEEWCTGLEIGPTCYFLTGDQQPFHDGLANCQAHDGRMAMLKDPQDHDQIRTFLLSQAVGDIWIGATDNDGDMTFTWQDGTTMTEGDWAYGEPNNPNQACAQMWRNVQLKWDDDYCSYRKNILCEKQKQTD